MRERASICGSVVSGLLALNACTADGREQIVDLVYPAGFVGQPFAPRSGYSAVALTPSEVRVFPCAALAAALDDHRPMDGHLLRSTLAALDGARARMLLLGRGTAEERVAGFLLDMDAHLPPAPDGGFELPLARGQVADLLGLTIETVSRRLTGLRRAGLVALPSCRAVTILDRPALERLAGPG